MPTDTVNEAPFSDENLNRAVKRVVRTAVGERIGSVAVARIAAGLVQTVTVLRDEMAAEHGEPLAHIGVGHPDPTPSDGSGDCQSKNDRGVWCTLPAGHDGQHIGGDGKVVLAVWPNLRVAEPSAEAKLAGLREWLDADIGYCVEVRDGAVERDNFAHAAEMNARAAALRLVRDRLDAQGDDA